MQIFFKQNLAILAVPKTGSTAYELALRSHADIIFAKRRKHMTAGQFHNKTADFLNRLYGTKPEVVAVMRDPLSQIGSWFRYRSRHRDRPSSTHGLTFEEFVQALLQPDPPEFAKIGSQYHFLTLRDGSLPVHHLFAYENQPQFRAFLENRFGESLEFKSKNVSPSGETDLSPETLARLREARAKEFALYERLTAAGGYLHQECL